MWIFSAIPPIRPLTATPGDSVQNLVKNRENGSVYSIKSSIIYLNIKNKAPNQKLEINDVTAFLSAQCRNGIIDRWVYSGDKLKGQD